MSCYKYSLFLLFLFSYSCVHDPDEVKEVDTRLSSAGTVGKDEIGVNKDNRMIVQTQKELDDELRSAVWFNSQMIFEVRYLLFRLKSCKNQKRAQLSKEDFKDLDGAVLDKVRDKKDEEQVGINSDGEYRLISKEGYTKRLTHEREVKKELILFKEEIRDQLQRCEYL